MLARAVNARAILEVGTLGGYSTIWLARALAAGGRLVTLEFDPKHAVGRPGEHRRAAARRPGRRAPGRAIDTLPKIAAEGLRPFDLVFIDADKAEQSRLFHLGAQLTRPGSLILVDNVVRDGSRDGG